MSRDKQVEEMARVMVDSDNKDVADTLSLFFVRLSEALYNAGYRKQTEGEWLSTTNITISERGRRINSTLYICSACRKSNGRHKTNYCPHCGAKMKGGEG